MKCLLVDDSASMLELMKHHLSQADLPVMEVLEARDGTEAIARYKEHEPDVMLLDYVLPDMTGLDVLRQLGGRRASLPVVMVTSFNDVEAIVEAVNCGAQNYLLKDRLSPGSLRLAIEDARQKHKITKDLAFQKHELERFTHTVAHDLRDQISGIYGSLNFLLEQSDGLNEAQLKMVRLGCEASARMQEFVNDLLSYALAGHRQQAFAAFSLQEALEEAKRNLAERIDTVGAHIHQESALPELLGSRRMMVQLFQNLLSNSMKYCGASKPEIHITATDCGDSWEIVFRDNGKGIDKAHHRNIFHAFEQIADGKTIEGIGVGLATCRRIIEDIHLGRIWVESERGKGAAFHFTLPKEDLRAQVYAF